MTQLLTPSSLSAALAQIALERWGAKGSIVSALRLATIEDPAIGAGWALVSGRVLADFTGLDRWHAFRRLEQLVDDRVVLRRAKGRGSRPGEYRINPALDQWRGVPWRVGRGQALATVARVLAGASARHQQAFVARHSSALEPFAARPGSAQISASGAPRFSTNGELVARPGSAQIAAGDAAHLLPREPKGSPPREDEEEVESPTVNAVLAAYQRSTGKSLWGAPRRDVVTACNGAADTRRIVDAIHRAGPTLGPAGLAVVVRDAQATSHPAAGREQLERRRLVLQSYVDNGFADEDHLIELAECDNALMGGQR